MKIARIGDRVRIHYARIHEPAAPDGTPPGHKEREFTVGANNVTPTISLGVVGMVQGEHKRFALQPRESHGEVNAKLIKEIPRKRIPKALSLEVGKRLTAVQRITGRRRVVRVIEVRPNSVIVDGNHPLAGKVIELDVTLVSVDSSPEANRTKPQLDVGGEG